MPPSSWDTASAANTPVVPIQMGRITVSGRVDDSLAQQGEKHRLLGAAQADHHALAGHLQGHGNEQAEVDPQGGDARLPPRRARC